MISRSQPGEKRKEKHSRQRKCVVLGSGRSLSCSNKGNKASAAEAHRGNGETTRNETGEAG